MTVVLGFRFPLGRYHATPWGRAVNEAVVDWPPSPWRILRGLYATWKWRAPDLPEGNVLRAFHALAEAPEYALPRYSIAHTRHYMPDPTFLWGGKDKDKALDPFTVFDPEQEILVRWAADLDDPTSRVLSRLCSLLPYLGRAESICESRVLDPAEVEAAATKWLIPGKRGDLGAAGVRVLAPTLPLDLDALTATTTGVRRAGRTTPPATRWVNYMVLPPDQPGARTVATRAAATLLPTAVRLSLSSPALPSIHDALVYGHVLRKAAMKRRDFHSPTLSGRPLESSGTTGVADGWRFDDHRHAHFLVFDADGDRLLDTAVVWAPEGLGDVDVEALLRISKLTSNQPGFRPVRAAVEAVGSVGTVASELCDTARRWKSATPFAPYRHHKRGTFESFLQGEIDRELAIRDLPPAVVVPVPGDWLSFRRARPGHRDTRAYGLELEFAGGSPSSPACLGALSHFGLGLFRPER